MVDFSPEGLQLKLAEAAGGAAGEAGAVSTPFSPVQLLLVGLLGGVVAGFTINLPIMLGEELGWRGFLFEETKPLGFWRASLLIGVLWGLWHAPVILVGHNYPGQGFAGIGMMVLLCLPLSVLMNYVRVKTRSVWGPAVLHGIFNASAPVTVLLIHQYNPLLGGITGLAGILAISLVTTVVLGLDRSFWRELAEEGFGGRKPVAAEAEVEMVK
jgi:hypothetical protein